MFLSIPTVRKLFRETFSGDNPLRIEIKELSRISKQWQDSLSQIDGVHLTFHPGDRDSRARTLCRFTIVDPNVDRHQYRSDEVRLEYDEELRLRLAVRRTGAEEITTFVSDLDEIKSLIRQVQSRYSRDEASRRKASRLRAFKTKAIHARVRQLATRQGFSFCFSSETKSIRLSILLSAKELIELSLPLDGYEKSLASLESTIDSLRLLHASGIRVKSIRNEKRVKQMEWESPETGPPADPL